MRSIFFFDIAASICVVGNLIVGNVDNLIVDNLNGSPQLIVETYGQDVVLMLQMILIFAKNILSVLLFILQPPFLNVLEHVNLMKNILSEHATKMMN